VAVAERSTPPQVLLAVGPVLMGLHDLVRPPLLPEDRELLVGAILVLGGLCAALGVQALVRAGVAFRALWPLPLCAAVIVLVIALPAPGGASFASDLLLRLGPALATVAYAAVALTWRPSRAVTAAFTVTVLVAALDVLIRPVGTEWMIAGSLNEGWGPFGAELVGTLAFDLTPGLTRVLDGVALLVAPCLLLAARADAASTPA
jgi:hypothetical protein